MAQRTLSVYSYRSDSRTARDAERKCLQPELLHWRHFPKAFVNILNFLANHWGDLASLLGVGLAIWASYRAKSAAEQARDAARHAASQIATLDTLADVAAALAIMEEIKRLQRVGAWQIALDRYSTLRRHLVRVEQLSPGLTDAQRGQVAGTIAQFRIIEKKIEKAMSANDATLDLSRFNAIVSAQIDGIESILTAIKKAGV